MYQIIIDDGIGTVEIAYLECSNEFLEKLELASNINSEENLSIKTKYIGEAGSVPLDLINDKLRYFDIVSFIFEFGFKRMPNHLINDIAKECRFNDKYFHYIKSQIDHCIHAISTMDQITDKSKRNDFIDLFNKIADAIFRIIDEESKNTCSIKTECENISARYNSLKVKWDYFAKAKKSDTDN